MNIRRAFLVLAAALLMPGLALAGTTGPAVFHVGMHFDDNNDWDAVDVHISCDGGLPLSNTSATPLEDDDDLNFILEFPGVGAGATNCRVWADDVAGYTAYYGEVHGDSPYAYDDTGCLYTEVDLDDENYCPIHMEPDDSYLRVYKTWDILGTGGDIIDYEAQIAVCVDRKGLIKDSSQAGSNLYKKYCVNQTVFGPADGYLDVTFDGTSHGGDTVYIYERTFDSSIEIGMWDCVSSPTPTPGGGGQGGTSYTVVNGDGTGSGTGSNNCTITNTIFFEGIPTLNQYGLAIMVLLMMGVGFVGFRRFV